jgi:hypothetical protein
VIVMRMIANAKRRAMDVSSLGSARVSVVIDMHVHAGHLRGDETHAGKDQERRPEPQHHGRVYPLKG